MKLNELAAQRPTKYIAKVFESYFGGRIKFEQLDSSQTRNMLGRVTKLVKEHRNSPEFHRSEQNQSYLQLIMMEQGLTQRLRELAADREIRRIQRLQESEVQQAQVVLAAQDMVDSVQGMLEDVSEMQFKELPALVDSIRNQVGTAQADNSILTPTLLCRPCCKVYRVPSNSLSKPWQWSLVSKLARPVKSQAWPVT